MSGLEESRYVFLESNGLPGAWKNLESYTVGELGFGTGLNFFLTWKLWRETKAAESRLHYLSFEKYPLENEQILKAMHPWPEISALAEELTPQLPSLLQGYHRIHIPSDNVFLTLVYGDANDTLPQLQAKVDTWYLDGFAPSKNPELWNPSLFKELARCSKPGARCATFSSARVVKDALCEAGFDYQVQKGFAHKRDMIVARFAQGSLVEPKSVQTAAVIGSGISGSLTAYALAHRGIEVTVFEKGAIVAPGASGNSAGILMPYPTAAPSAMGEFFLSAHEFAWQQIVGLNSKSKDLLFSRCGVISLIVKSQLENLNKKFSTLHLPSSFARQVSAKEISEDISMRVEHGGFLFEKSGWLKPAEYCCLALASNRNIKLQLSKKISSLVDENTVVFEDSSQEEFDVVVVANAYEAEQLLDLSALRLGRIRGQLLLARANEKTEDLARVLCHEGYILPQMNGMHLIGASYDRENEHLEEIPEQNVELLKQLEFYLKDIGATSFEVHGSRVGIRSTTADKRPYVGRFPNGQYLNIAHGSRGLVSAGLSGELIASQVVGDPLPLGKNLVQSLSPDRHLS
jgi:tRNA 5-methylaminomethyl-2-thiouridine biosynthesis bifunctional protein